MWEFLFGWVVGAACSAPSRPLTAEEREVWRQVEAELARPGGSSMGYSTLGNLSFGPSYGARLSKPIGLTAVVTVKDGIAYNESWTTKG